MTDIVDDLREYDREVFSGGLMLRAADEIERLREALEKIAQPDYGYMDIIESGQPPEKQADYFCSMVNWRRIVARAALEGQP